MRARFCTVSDMEEEMRREGIPLYGLESGDGIAEFDIIAFSLGYEMAYTNVLNMLDLAGLPVKSTERTENMPLVAAGGTVCYNPEVMSQFIDLFFIGEGENLDREVFELYRECKEKKISKAEFLKLACRIEGVYVPSMYDVAYGTDGKILDIKPQNGAPRRVTKRIVQDFEHSYYPVDTIVPSTEIVHDRVVLEVFRGCIRGCRFCQAGYAYRPVRARSPETLVKQGIVSLAGSGL